MLSDTTRGGVSGATLAARQILYSRGNAVRTGGMIGSVALLALLAGTMVIAPAGTVPGIVMVLPVALASWFGSVWIGRSVAVGGSALQLGAMHLAASAPGGAAWIGVAVTLGVLLFVSEVVPGLRFSAQAYREHAQMDPLTNLGNRRFFREVASVELNRSKRYSRPVSLVCLDADGFERLRHTAGHADADMLLVQMASVMTGSLRTSDVLARISGAEFAILLPETDGPGAQVVAGKLRQRLTDTAAAAGHTLTFRAAVVGFGDGPVSPEAMFRQADQAMVEAGRSGEDLLAYRDYEHPPLQLV